MPCKRRYQSINQSPHVVLNYLQLYKSFQASMILDFRLDCCGHCKAYIYIYIRLGLGLGLGLVTITEMPLDN